MDNSLALGSARVTSTSAAAAAAAAAAAIASDAVAAAGASACAARVARASEGEGGAWLVWREMAAGRAEAAARQRGGMKMKAKGNGRDDRYKVEGCKGLAMVHQH
jgi:hypothetical protein